MVVNLFLSYLVWSGKEVPFLILKAWRNTLWFTLHYFSILTLVGTLFSPWRRYSWQYKGGFSIGGYLEALASNFFSRIIGAAMRLPLIATGLFFAILVFFAGAGVLALWFLLPLIISLSFSHAIRILF
jgi:hypothetical protein